MSEKSVPSIGLMGAPGAGKSLVARQMASLGCMVIDSDALAKQALDEPEVVDQLVKRWGEGILTDQGRVDRSVLADLVFADPDRRKQLEGIIHPRVHAGRAVLRKQALEDPKVLAIVEDSPLLLESGIDRDCDALVFVDAPRALRLQRVTRDRGWDALELSRREKSQMPLDIKRERADYVISNDASEAHCLEQTREVLSRITH